VLLGVFQYLARSEVMQTLNSILADTTFYGQHRLLVEELVIIPAFNPLPCMRPLTPHEMT
jgi:hypothetical protein